MTIQFRNPSNFLIGQKVCSRNPPAPEVMLVVRAVYDIDDAGNLTLRVSEEITEENVAMAAEAHEQAGIVTEKARIRLGQGTLSPETYEPDDENRVGEVLYPGDFADFKLNAEVLVRGHCYAPKGATECELELSVDRWSKKLRVVGTRVRTDDMGGKTEPQPIGKMAVDYAHAYGGPGFGNNLVGKGHLEKVSKDAFGDEEELYQPPRSERSKVMAAKQLPNVLYARGAEKKGELPAGFGPLSPSSPYRTKMLGTQYGAEWLATRAPYYAKDFNGRYFHAAPPDQQLKGFLAGDELVSVSNMHPRKRTVAVRLLGLRVRMFIIDDRDDVREAKMMIDTVFLDLDDDALYVTWRGHTSCREEDLLDIQFGYCDVEPIGEPAKSFAHYEALVRALKADPYDLEEGFPAGFHEFAANVERIESASDEEIEAMADKCMMTDDPGGPVSAAIHMIFGPMVADAPPEMFGGLTKAGSALSAGELRDKVLEILRGTGGAGGAGLSPTTGKVHVPIGKEIRKVEEAMANAEKKEITPGAQARIDAARQRIADANIAEIDPNYKPFSEDDGPPDEPAPHANLAGRDFSNVDLSGRDLTGANFDGAILSRTNLAGSCLKGASMAGVTMFRTNLEGADLSGADLTTASLVRVRGNEARFDGCKMDMSRLDKSAFQRASFAKVTGLMTIITKCDFEEATVVGASWVKMLSDECNWKMADLSHASLDGCTFKDGDLTGTRLHSAKLDNAAFHMCTAPKLQAQGATGKLSVWMKTKLEKADFGGASLPAAHFMQIEAADVSFLSANLPDARFDRAILKRACFDGAKLSHANLRKTVLTQASFIKASLYDAKLMQSHGTDVDFSGATLDKANFHRSEIDRR